MTDPRKDFTPIQGDYAFFATHSDEPESDLQAYADRLRSFTPPAGSIRMLDFGCGPGTFTSLFLERMNWGKDRLDLALVEPSDAYRGQAVARLASCSDRPLRAWPELPGDLTEKFDLILSNHVLYYVPALESTLDRLARALSPGGLFLATLAGRTNALVDFWFRAFPTIGKPVPYQTAEDLEAALKSLGHSFDRREKEYTLGFADTTENRLKIFRFLFGEHLKEFAEAEMLDLFTPYVAGDRVDIRTSDVQYYIRGLP
jgi:trans-aconitate 2-methyltransferase